MQKEEQDKTTATRETEMPMYRLKGKKEIFVAGLPTGEFKEHVHTFSAESDQDAIVIAGAYQRENSVSFGEVVRVHMHIISSEGDRA
jgi:phosphoribosyl-AMP cyclohydrolase